MAKSIFNCRDLTANTVNELEENGFQILVYHDVNDPVTTNRVKVSSGRVELELLPSKGFSLGQAWIKGQPIFWEAPIGLCDTENLDLWSDEIKINGNPTPGFTFLKTLVSGVELYGLKNWGMPLTINGKLYPLHGETSNIPLNEVQFTVENENTCHVEASFIYRTFEGDANLPWYERGEALFRVTKKLTIRKDALEIKLEDTIENISNAEQISDWGYHITFRPEEGAVLKVPSKRFQERNHNPLPDDFETWHEAENEHVRTETGIVHKEMRNEQGVTSVLTYPNQTAIAVTVPPSPYFQTWFCNGGKGSKEFTDSNNQSILEKKWDGMGIEIGSSALDHDGNIDPSVVPEKALKPGESRQIVIGIELVQAKYARSWKE